MKLPILKDVKKWTIIYFGSRIVNDQAKFTAQHLLTLSFFHIGGCFWVLFGLTDDNTNTYLFDINGIPVQDILHCVAKIIVIWEICQC